jgi:flagellar hook protein FlgE
MALSSSMFSAANGLNAHSDAMNVVSDNIANISTTGFKQNQARFADILSSTVADAAAGKAQGQGALLKGIQTNFTQGTMQPTGRSTDLALQGNGFFVVKGAFAGSSGEYYTRDGGFHLDSTGSLVNASGLVVQGYMADDNGVAQTQVSDMRVGGVALVPPHPTSAGVIRANLDSTAPVIPFNLAEPASTSTFGTSITIFDSRGADYDCDLYFCNQGGNKYSWHAVVDGGSQTGGTAGTNMEMGTGTLEFNTDGFLVTPAKGESTFNFSGADQDQKITFTFGDSLDSGGTGRDGVTSYAGTSNITFLEQDGYAEGALLGVAVDDSGEVRGSFTNGLQRFLGTVAVANFVNQEGLGRVGGSLYISNGNSGLPAIGPPGVGGRGNIVAGSLEQSNVNLSQEFVNLLTYQRGFEANTRSIKASDQMLQELVNLTR